jgi:O-succinylbenzoic acid--CoA ligase
MTYGMAETLSHVALRRLNGPYASSWYSPLPGVDISLNEAGCLQINAPWAVSHPVITKDMGIQQPDGRFSVIGRSDNLISTGGMKVHAETLESIFSQWVPVPFAITSLPDIKYGERIILVSEKNIDVNLLNQYEPRWQIPIKYVW